MYLIIGICLNFSIGICSAIVNPKIVAVIADQNMTLECRIDNESTFLSWNFISTSHPTTKALARNENGIVSLNPDYQHFDAYVDMHGAAVLYTNATKIEYAGTYICAVVTRGNVQQYSGQVIVLKSEPNCSSNFTGNRSLTIGDHIWMQCKVDYNGNLAPIMIWRQHFIDTRRNDSGMIITNGTETVNISNSSTVSSLIFDIDFQHDASYFECEITFAYDRNTSLEKTFQHSESSHTWRSPAIYLMLPEDTTTDATFSSGPSDSISPSDVSSTAQPANWFFIAITWGIVVTVLFVLAALVACAYCVKHWKKSAEIAMLEETNNAEYDVIPKDFDFDEYDKIDNARIGKDVPLEILPRQGPLPSAGGYSVLMPLVPAEEAAYSKVATTENKVEEDTKDAAPQNGADANTYLTLMDHPPEKDRDSHTADDRHSYLTLHNSNEIPAEESRSAKEMSSDYLTPRD